jgi:serine/threonine protein phosphatase 1
MQLSRHSAFAPATMIARLFGIREAHERAVPPGRRIYAVGDIHGRLDLFEQLLAMIEDDQHGREPIVPEIVLLGDMIDRGPASAGVVRRAMALAAEGRLTALMGNHEASLLEAIDGNVDAMRTWLRFGGLETLHSWGVTDEVIGDATVAGMAPIALAAIPPAELAWLRALRQNLHVGDYFLVHAGVRPGVGLEQQAPDDSFWIREEFLDSRREHGALVVHGHTISSGVEEHDNRIGIDTGAYESGRLTALALEGNQRWFLQTPGEEVPGVDGDLTA